MQEDLEFVELDQELLFNILTDRPDVLLQDSMKQGSPSFSAATPSPNLPPEMENQYHFQYGDTTHGDTAQGQYNQELGVAPPNVVCGSQTLMKCEPDEDRQPCGLVYPRTVALEADSGQLAAYLPPSPPLDQSPGGQCLGLTDLPGRTTVNYFPQAVDNGLGDYPGELATTKAKSEGVYRFATSRDQLVTSRTGYSPMGALQVPTDSIRESHLLSPTSQPAAALTNQVTSITNQGACTSRSSHPVRGALRSRIEEKRRQSGLPEEVPEEKRLVPERLSAGDDEKKERRRRQNREAAERCRKKKKEYWSELPSRVEQLERSNKAQERSIADLRKELAELIKTFQSHQCVKK